MHHWADESEVVFGELHHEFTHNGLLGPTQAVQDLRKARHLELLLLGRMQDHEVRLLLRQPIMHHSWLRGEQRDHLPEGQVDELRHGQAAVSDGRHHQVPQELGPLHLVLVHLVDIEHLLSTCGAASAPEPEDAHLICTWSR